MKKLYLDTTAFFTIFEEQIGEAVERIFSISRDGKVQIIISDWVINESIAKLDENKKNGIITQAEVQQILSELLDMMEGKSQKYQNIIIYPITNRVIVDSKLVIQDYHINASQALHVYISAAAQCDFFVSAEPDLINLLTSGKIKLTAYNINSSEDFSRLFVDIG